MRVKLLGEEYSIEQRLPHGQLLLKHFASGTSSVKSEQEIAKALSHGDGEVLGKEYERDEARYGRRIANLPKRTNDTAIIPTHRLDRPQVDHTKLDLVVIDEKTRIPVCRSWLRIRTCAFTRMILALELSPDQSIEIRRSV